jgi:serine/threonine protein kinase/tetratricopeptide (TPR) repeat protein
MSPLDSTCGDERLLSLLVACDQALAAGDEVDGPSGVEVAPEMRERLEGDLACIQLLRQLLPRRAPVRALTAPADAPVVELGDFQVRRELGRGAFGVVFLAYDTNLRREVALKIPRPEALPTTELRLRFLREARAAAGLDHPNLVPVFEVHADGPVCYIASAYCPGITLAAWLKERNWPVPVREAAQLVATLADAVQHAHGRGVVHRDLTPANILLQESQAHNLEPETHNPKSEPRAASDYGSRILDFCPKITDFGLAKFISTEAGTFQTQTGAIMGTPSYMAPEQASRHDQEVGPAADVYALGAILYELLVGWPPFRGETTLDTLEMVRSEEPVSPRRLVPKLARDVETICLKCLEKDPGRRYASATALAHDLQAFLAGDSIEARPPRLRERGVKGARRHPALAALLVVLVMATAAVLALSAVYQAQLRQMNRELTKALAKANLHRQQEDANLHLARKVVRSTHDQPYAAHQLWLLRGEALQAVIPLYDDLIQRYPRDSELQAERGTVYLQLGRVVSQARTISEAEPSLGKAEAIFRQLAHDSPAVAAYEALLGKVRFSQGLACFETYRLAQAEQYYREAFAIGETLCRREPAVEEYQVLFAQGHIKLAGLYLDTDRLEEAETALTKASAFAEELARDHAGVLTCRAVQAESLNGLGALYHRTGRFEQAEATFLKARDLSEKLVGERPAFEDYQSRLGRSLSGLGDAHSALGQVQAAESAYDTDPSNSVRDPRAQTGEPGLFRKG